MFCDWVYSWTSFIRFFCIYMCTHIHKNIQITIWLNVEKLWYATTKPQNALSLNIRDLWNVTTKPKNELCLNVGDLWYATTKPTKYAISECLWIVIGYYKTDKMHYDVWMLGNCDMRLQNRQNALCLNVSEMWYATGKLTKCIMSDCWGIMIYEHKTDKMHCVCS